MIILTAAKLICITMILCTAAIGFAICYANRPRTVYIMNNVNGEYVPVGALKSE